MFPIIKAMYLLSGEIAAIGDSRKMIEVEDKSIDLVVYFSPLLAY